MEKGKYVTRAAYQKLAEENKRLLCDIRVLVEEAFPPKLEKIVTISRWREKFRKDKELVVALQDWAKEYLKEHPEMDVQKTVVNRKKNK